MVSVYTLTIFPNTIYAATAATTATTATKSKGKSNNNNQQPKELSIADEE